MAWLASGSYPQISRHRGDMSSAHSGICQCHQYHHVISCTTYQSFPINTSTIYNIIQPYITTWRTNQSVPPRQSALPSTATSSQCSQFLLRGSVTHMAWSLSARRKGMWKRQLDHNLWQQPAIACFLRHKKASSRISHSSGKLCSQWENSASSLQPLTVIPQIHGVNHRNTVKYHRIVRPI